MISSLLPAALLIVTTCGILVGASVGLVGTGSILAVPLLMYGVGLDVHRAVCVAMLATTFLGLVGSIENICAGMNSKTAVLMAITGTIFAPVGALLGQRLRPVQLLILFSVVVFMISVRMFLRTGPIAQSQSQEHDVVGSPHSLLVVSGAGGLIGLLGGLLGISGGFIAVPVLVTYQGLDMHRAVATSWVIVAVISTFATIGHFLAGQRVPFGDAALFIISAIGGFELAIRVAPHFSATILKRVFAGITFAVSLTIFARTLSG